MTADLIGEPVKSGELFAAHELTVVYVFTSLGVTELPKLAAYAEELKEKDMAVCAIVADSNDEGAVDRVREAMTTAGGDFRVLLPPANLSFIFPCAEYPTVYFVKRNGESYGEAVVGTSLPRYREVTDGYSP